MQEHLKFYIGGQWVEPAGNDTIEVTNPATEQLIGRVAKGTAADVDRAVLAARKAFPAWSNTSREERLEILQKIEAAYIARAADLTACVTSELGAPTALSEEAQVPIGHEHIATTIEILRDYPFSRQRDERLIRKEAIGVCGMITPWNWPLNQVMCKVMPAIAAGCTMVLKPSELTPLNAIIVAEIIDQAGLPPGVFNLVNGDGPGVGAAISAHPDIDMVSFTGSTRAGIEVACAAAETVKRVTQELGGKSPNIILEDADLATAVSAGVEHCFSNSGQSCNAPTRMFVPAARHAEAVEIARQVAEATVVGDPTGDGVMLGPVVSAVQFDKIQRLIQQGLDEGAELVAGGTGRPPGLERGYYVRPTVFAGVRNDMTIAREEIFGPVLSILPYQTEAEAIAMANDTPYGLAAYIQSGDPAHAAAVAAQIRAGQVIVNGIDVDTHDAFGGYKQSGNGREWGVEGFEEFLEVKVVTGVT